MLESQLWPNTQATSILGWLFRKIIEMTHIRARVTMTWSYFSCKKNSYIESVAIVTICATSCRRNSSLPFFPYLSMIFMMCVNFSPKTQWTIITMNAKLVMSALIIPWYLPKNVIKINKIWLVIDMFSMNKLLLSRYICIMSTIEVPVAMDRG